MPSASRRSAEDAASAMLRGVWATLAGGRAAIPVDPALIATALGIEVIEADLAPSVSGAIRKRRGEDPVILLNRRDSLNRRRFTCAHELGHYVQHADEPDEFDYLDYRDPAASSGTVDEEVFANQFAASLLMPDADVRAAHREAGGSAVELAFRFRVSQDAMGFRLRNLGLTGG